MLHTLDLTEVIPAPRSLSDTAAELEAAQLTCLLAVLAGNWDEVGFVAHTLSGSQFPDAALGALYDLVVGDRSVSWPFVAARPHPACGPLLEHLRLQHGAEAWRRVPVHPKALEVLSAARAFCTGKILQPTVAEVG